MRGENMPWTESDVDRFKKGLSDKQKSQWVAVANAVLKKCMENGGAEEECAKKAIIQANGVVGEPEKCFIKALGDWELDVLAVPFGSEFDKDSDEEYFDANTNLFLDNYLPPAFYYHGYSPDGEPMGEPALIGKTESAEVREDGVWLRVILDKASEFAQRVWNAAKEGLARASSGSISHLVRADDDGHITSWPLAEISLFDIDGYRQPANQYAVAIPVLKSNFEHAGLPLPDWSKEAVKGHDAIEPNQDKEDSEEKAKKEKEKEKMEDKTEKPIEAIVKEQVAASLKALKDEEDAQKAHEAEIEVEKQKAVDEAMKKAKEEYAKSRRLPFDEAPVVAKFGDLWKYDNLDSGELALGIDVLNTGKAKGKKGAFGASENMYRALAVRLSESKEPGQQHSLKALEHSMGKPYKSNEVMYSTLSTYGDDWVGVEYSRDLWEKIRMGTPIVSNIPQMEIPQGYESATIPLESTDPTWYKVSQATGHTTGRVDVTVTASKVGTLNKSITLSKLGARVTWSGELAEDSLIPILPQIRSQMIVSGQEQLENAIINGDDATATVTNINDIAGTPAGTEVFMVFDGFRRVGLNSNSRDAGSHDVNDYLETLKLMGTAGINGLDINKTAFIIGPQEYYSLMKEEEVKTQDVFSKATLEKGNIVALWGRKLIVSGQMCAASSDRLSNSDGCVDVDTTNNNAYGTILAIRWDQWKFAWKRRMTLETDRWPEADTNQLVAMFRCGLGYFDNDAAAISYKVTI